MDRPNPNADGADRNSRLAKRFRFIAESREVDLIGRKHSDIFFQERYMLNEVTTRNKLTRNKYAFCFMAAGDQSYKVQITVAARLVCNVKISPSV
jgi:hypothetical protein